MDTSETYIRMCERATEIQPQLGEDGVGGTWIGGNILYHLAPMNQPHDRDGFYHVTDTIASRECDACGNEETYIQSSRCIWLPRQDQLQEMYSSDLYTLLHDFGRWIEFHTDGSGKYKSMEQLWLAFVMKEKYNKIWNGQDWEVETFSLEA